MDRKPRRHLWGWDLPKRRLLAVLAIVFASGLGISDLRRGRGSVTDPMLVVDPNDAPPQVLMALPRIGPVLAGRMVDERERQPFQSLTDLDARVRGVGPATATAIGPYLKFRTAGVSPVAP